MNVNKNKIDVSRAFMVYMALVGDVEKTAAALDLDPAVVQELAEAEGWALKVRRLSVMSKSEKPGDQERAINRALNFVQAHRVRGLVDALLQYFGGMTPEQIADALSTHDMKGKVHVSARFFADLSSAMEKVQNLSYQALGDTVRERSDRDEAGDGENVSAQAMHASLIAALNSAAAATVPAIKLVEDAAKQIIDVPVLAPTNSGPSESRPQDMPPQ